MKVIIYKTKHSKSIIGFAENTITFAIKWLSQRGQYTNINTINDNKVTFDYDNNNEKECRIYGSELKDEETCWISCDDNLMGFNDNH